MDVGVWWVGKWVVCGWWWWEGACVGCVCVLSGLVCDGCDLGGVMCGMWCVACGVWHVACGVCCGYRASLLWLWCVWSVCVVRSGCVVRAVPLWCVCGGLGWWWCVWCVCGVVVMVLCVCWAGGRGWLVGWCVWVVGGRMGGWVGGWVGGRVGGKVGGCVGVWWVGV